MQRVILVIRDGTDVPIADVHPDEATARRALAAYVRERTGLLSTRHAANDDGAIEAYFASESADYAIVGVAGDER